MIFREKKWPSDFLSKLAQHLSFWHKACQNELSWKLGLLSISDQFLPLPPSQESSSVCHRKSDFNQRDVIAPLASIPGHISLPSSHVSLSAFLAGAQVILKSNMLPSSFLGYFKRHSHHPKIGQTILHIVLSYESTFRQIAQHHLSHQRMKIVVIRKIILAAVFHFSLR